MAVTADRVIVELEAKIDRYDANVRRAEQQFTRSMGAIDKRAQQSSNVVRNSMRLMGTALAGVSAIALGRELLQLSDAAKSMESQLRLATASFGSFGQAQEDVRRISTETRNDITATATLYAAFARNANDLGINQKQVADITETVGKAFKVSGTDAASSADAIRQLTQAFQSGVLRGDEFNSMAENAPRLQRLLADSLGTTVGNLRAMAEAGELTSDKLVKAFSDKKFTAALDEEFKQIPVTFSDAMALVYNSALTTFSEFDRGGGFSNMLANFMTDGASGFGDLAESAQAAGIDIRASFEGLSDAFEPLINAAKAAFASIGSDALTMADRIRPLLSDIDAISGWLSKQGAMGAMLTGNSSRAWMNGTTSGTNLLGRFNKGYAASASQRKADIQTQDFNDRYGRFDPNDPTGLYGFGAKNRPHAAARVAAKPGKKGHTKAAPKSPLDPEAFAREEGRLNEQVLAAKADGATTAEDRAALELQRLQTEQANEAAETQANAKYTDAQKARLVALQGSVYALERLKVVADRDADVRERDGKAAEAHGQAVQENVRIEVDALNERYRLAETARGRAEIEDRLLTLAEEQERLSLEENIAKGRVADAEKARADLASGQRARRTGAALDNQGPLGRYLDETNRSDDERAELAEQWVVDELDRVKNAIADGITKRLGVDDPILSGILDLFIEQVIMRPIAEAFQSGGGGGLLGSAVSLISGALHLPGRASGGHVNAGKMYRVTDGEGFQSSQSGKIIPLGQMRDRGGGGVNLTQNIHVDASGSVSPDGFAEHIITRVRKETVAIVGAGMKQVNAGVPGRMAEFSRDGR